MSNQRKLLRNITCPHCWETFTPAEALWISASPDLMDDFRVGDMAQQRFLPSRFDVDGRAIDRRGMACKAVACPHCHLSVPLSHFEMRPYFISIAGAPASGKSYFLAGMVWQLRRILPKVFQMGFNDADPQMNVRLHEYETSQFLNDDVTRLHKIAKTEVQGDLYNTVQIGGQSVTYPQPFLFALSPLPGHPNINKSQKIASSLCLYDNAGESYLPTERADTATLPVTRHLGKSNCIFFLFDPTQDNRFRVKCRSFSLDPQITNDHPSDFRRSPLRQEMVLSEMIIRTRNYSHFSMNSRYTNSVVIIVTKMDAWRNLIPNLDLRQPWDELREGGLSILNLKRIQAVSNPVRKMLLDVTPEIVGAIEQFAADVIYIPVSATGGPPEINQQTGESGFRTENIRPVWVEVPMLYALARSTYGIIPIQ